MSIGILIHELKTTKSLECENHNNTINVATQARRVNQMFPVPSFDPKFVFFPGVVLELGTSVVLVLGVATDIGTNDPMIVLLVGEDTSWTSSVWMIGLCTTCRGMRLERAAGATVMGIASALAATAF